MASKPLTTHRSLQNDDGTLTPYESLTHEEKVAFANKKKRDCFRAIGYEIVYKKVTG